jgi:hypothetical protein
MELVTTALLEVLPPETEEEAAVVAVAAQAMIIQVFI